MNTEIKPLSSALSEPLTKAYRIGGFGLAFLVLGAIFLTASAVMPRGSPSYVLAAVGLVLVGVPCYFFYVKEIRPLAAAQRQVKKNDELIDSLQDAALKMTLAAYDLQALAYKYADEVGEIMRVARPIMRQIPLLQKVAEGSTLETVDWFTQNVVALTRRSEQVIADVRQALIDSNAAALKKYVGELEGLRADLEELLRAKAPVKA